MAELLALVFGVTIPGRVEPSSVGISRGDSPPSVDRNIASYAVSGRIDVGFFVMKAELFTQYMEKLLKSARTGGSEGTAGMTAREKIAWDLHEAGHVAGSILLADNLVDSRISLCRSDIDAVSFGRQVISESFPILESLEAKDGWDWYYLGTCYEIGRGTPSDLRKAAEYYRRAKDAGNPYAEFDEIWASYLAGSSIVETILRLRDYRGNLGDFAKASAESLSILALGPTRQVGSIEHAWRICEIARIQHRFLYNGGGSRQINIQAYKEMKRDVDELKALNTPSAALVLFLIAKWARANPTKERADLWLRSAIDSDASDLWPILKRNLDRGQLRFVADECKSRGREDSDLFRQVCAHLAGEDDNG